MIYLIGGPPRCGKSTLAKTLAKKLKISWVSVDTLEVLPKFYTPKKYYSKRFPKAVMRKKTGHSNELMYTKYSARQVKKAYTTQAESIWPAVELFATALIAETPENDFIIEGYQLPPRHVANLLKRHSNKVRVIYLIKEDAQAILAGFLAHKDPNDWVKSKSQSQDIYPKIARMLSLYSEKIKKEAIAYNLQVINTEINFQQQIAKALKLLSN